MSVLLLRVFALLSPFSGNPITYVIRTISEFDSTFLAYRKESNYFAIYEGDFLKVDGYFALFLFEQFSKCVHAISLNPSTHAQYNNVFNHKSLDSKGHWLPTEHLFFRSVPAAPGVPPASDWRLQTSAHSQSAENKAARHCRKLSSS